MRTEIVEQARDRRERRASRGIPGSLRAALVALGTVLGTAGGALAQLSAVEVDVRGASYPLEIARHHGYPAVRWSEVPSGLVAESFQRNGNATATVAGAPVELRVGSPFGRHGNVVFQLANTPYQASGEIWVPLEFFTQWLVRAETPASAGAAEPAASPRSTDPRVSGEQAPDRGYRKPGPWRVMIDAGHGGHDPGTISPRSGVREKDITLAVARNLRDELLRRDGIQPMLTRDRDVFVKVMDRPSMAVDMDADLFISIHVDAEPRRRSSARGFTTFYLGQARTDDALQVALRENAVIELEEGSEPPNMAQLEIILATVDRDAYRTESRLLAGHIQNGLRGVLGTRDRGAKPGPYYVLLTPGRRPAVLVELGFITNPDDEKSLTSQRTRKRIAGALADQIERYLEDAGRRIATVEGRG